jgi:hypothetical protein
MASTTLEKRVAALEEELARLKSRFEGLETGMPWWERIAGTFQNDPVYAKAMRLGQQYRQSQKLGGSSRKRK